MVDMLCAYVCLWRLQIYPENATQAEMMVAAAMKVGCTPGCPRDALKLCHAGSL
jgi:hypothetical protein